MEAHARARARALGSCVVLSSADVGVYHEKTVRSSILVKFENALLRLAPVALVTSYLVTTPTRASCLVRRFPLGRNKVCRENN